MTCAKALGGKIALITGAARGIGFATAVELSRLGADIVGLDLPGSPWDELRAAVDGAGRQLLACDGDASDETAWQTVLTKVQRQFGRIDPEALQDKQLIDTRGLWTWRKAKKPDARIEGKKSRDARLRSGGP